jgi:ribose-phosphate pyrophosphokinase
MTDDLMLFAGNSNPSLSAGIASYLQLGLGEAKVDRFSDGEIRVEIQTSVRHRDVFIVQSLSSPVNDNLMELLVMVDAMRRASAKSITAVIPYYGYARQDRKSAPRTPITAKLIADLLEASGVDRVITMDLHASQIQGFFSKPVDHLYGSKVLVDAIGDFIEDSSRMVIVSPDAGGVERARYYSKCFGCSLAIVDKRRSGPGVAEAMHIIGDVAGRDAILVDDMIDTAGTLTEAANTVAEHGARRVIAAATHPVLSGPAVERITQSRIERVMVTDTIPLGAGARECEKLMTCSVNAVVGEGIRRIHGGSSLSSLFEWQN